MSLPTSWVGCVLFLFMGLIYQSHQQDYNSDVMLGINYKNFTNYEGRLADGSCCDNPDLDIGSTCPPNTCDTAFETCADYVGEVNCSAYFIGYTVTTENENSIVFDDIMGNYNGKSSSLIVYRSKYREDDIIFTINAVEMPGEDLMAEFIFVIDWMDTSYSDPPDYHQLLLKAPQAELGIDVFRQCFYGYYGSICGVYCLETDQYICADDGSKICRDGWQGEDCDQMISTTTPASTTVATIAATTTPDGQFEHTKIVATTQELSAGLKEILMNASDDSGEDVDIFEVILVAVIAALSLGLLILLGLVVWKNNQRTSYAGRYRSNNQTATSSSTPNICNGTDNLVYQEAEL